MERKTEEILKYPIEETEKLRQKLCILSSRTDKLIISMFPIIATILMGILSILFSINKYLVADIILIASYLIFFIAKECDNNMHEIEYYNNLLEVISTIETIRGYNFKQQLIEKYTPKYKTPRKDIKVCTQTVSLPTLPATAAYQRRTRLKITLSTSSASGLKRSVRQKAGANPRCLSTRASRAERSNAPHCDLSSRTFGADNSEQSLSTSSIGSHAPKKIRSILSRTCLTNTE